MTVAYVEKVAPADAEAYAVFRCAQCECVNVAWEGTEKFNAAIEQGLLTRSIALCRSERCKCHTTGGRIQAKKTNVGKDAPWLS